MHPKMYSYSLNTNLETNTCISWVRSMVRCCHTQCAVYLRENIQPPLSRLTHSAHAGLARNVLKNL